MQKVSKQSLAMIALSILLAISIALTFTFAAAQASKTATGTITFSGQAALVINGFSGTTDAGTFDISVGTNNTVTVAGKDAAALSDMSFGLATTSAPAYIKVAISVNGQNIEIGNTITDKAVAVKMSNPSDFTISESDTKIMTTTKKIAANTTWTLDNVLSFVADITKYADETSSSTVTLTITADTNSANL